MFHAIRWTPEKITLYLRLLAPLVYRERVALAPFRYQRLDDSTTPPPLNADTSTWAVIPPDTIWGELMSYFALATHFEIPPEWNDSAALVLPIGEPGDFSHPEALLYIDGEAYAAADRHHQRVTLSPRWCDGQQHTLFLHGWTGLGGYFERIDESRLVMRQCYAARIDTPTEAFLTAARVALDVALYLKDTNPVKARLYNALNAAFNALETRDPLGTAAFYESVPNAYDILQDGIAAAGHPLDVDILGIGHAHIDVAWMWTPADSVHKAARTFSTALHLMDEYPDYHFSQSQPQLYQYVEQHQPEMFERIKARVSEGRWEVMGGTWVEPDCNAIGSESLARQFVLGRGYFRRHFGADSDTPVLWLPDTFGYSWALPQLIRQAGMKYFITHKMSWNQYNRMPYQVFMWQGLDGTRILTHFLTTPEFSVPDAGGTQPPPATTTYNGIVNAAQVFGTWENFAQKDAHHELMTAYGWGDGGGGPTREMIQTIQALGHHAGAPRMRFGTIRQFMTRIEDEIPAEALPVWNGEFYLEYHRGTYTSQARTKRDNRKGEFALHNAEFLEAWAGRNTLARAWELLCLNQFHDILPGSSIAPVYEQSAREYDEIRRLAHDAITTALDALAPAPIVAVNANPFGGARIGFLEGMLAGGMMTDSGEMLLSQSVDGGTLVLMPDVPPYSITGLQETDAQPESAPPLIAEARLLENTVLRVEFDDTGHLTRVYDKVAMREVMPDGARGNALIAYEDRPMRFDAWDIDMYYDDKPYPVTEVSAFEVIEAGSLRAGLRLVRRYRNSTISQYIYLYRDSRRIDFETVIDWHEQNTLLRVLFPVAILSPLATFDVQWGNVQRPTHRNTSWDWARFETCAHKWADLGEGGYGVALLNDCKYGYSVHDNVLGLSLLKSAVFPDFHADQGEHHVTYSLYPHVGDWREGVPAAAYDLNNPLMLRRVATPSAQGGGGSFITTDARHVVIETVKPAEDGRGVIVRLFENERTRGKFTLTAGFALAAASVCNLLEEDEITLMLDDSNRLTLDIAPYQIITLRLIPALERVGEGTISESA